MADECPGCKRIRFYDDDGEVCGPCARRLVAERDMLRGKLDALATAATQFPRCCVLWQDSRGGMHCPSCGRKTFQMMNDIQKLLGVGKDGAPLAADDGTPPPPSE